MSLPTWSFFSHRSSNTKHPSLALFTPFPDRSHQDHILTIDTVDIHKKSSDDMDLQTNNIINKINCAAVFLAWLSVVAVVNMRKYKHRPQGPDQRLTFTSKLQNGKYSSLPCWQTGQTNDQKENCLTDKVSVLASFVVLKSNHISYHYIYIYISFIQKANSKRRGDNKTQRFLEFLTRILALGAPNPNSTTNAQVT